MNFPPPKPKHIVIIGGGIIGCTTAYYLTRHSAFDKAHHRITLLEAASIAAGASGKAGGLLAKWAYPQPLVSLSYQLHAELAAEYDGKQRWGYRKLGCGSIEAVGLDPLGAEIKSSTSPSLSAPETALSTSASKPPAPVANTHEGSTTAVTFALIDNSEGEEKVGTKNWEKLHKQNMAATSLLIPDSPLPKDLDWFNSQHTRKWAEMGIPGITTETAQVHPFHFTTSIAQFAREGGVTIVEGAKVTDIRTHPKMGVQAVVYEQRLVPISKQEESISNPSVQQPATTSQTINDVTEVVICAGPWTGRLLPKSGIGGPRVHSVLYEADVSPYAVFTQIKLPEDFVPEHRRVKGQTNLYKGFVDPEVYARPFGEVYACGETDRTVPLPETADQVEASLEACEDITAYLSLVSPALARAPVKARQACYLPVHTRFGEEQGPLIGKTATPRLYVASGHSCWGIQNGPATGKLMSEILMEGKARSAKIDHFDPRNFKVDADANTRTEKKGQVNA